jgi:hypothetical protein
MRDVAVSVTDREQAMLEAVRQYFVRADSGRSDVLDLFTDDVQIYFPKFGLARGKACFGEWRPDCSARFRQSRTTYRSSTT